MKENYFSKKMSEKSDSALKSFIKNKDQFQKEAVLAAQWELEKRGLVEKQNDEEDIEPDITAESKVTSTIENVSSVEETQNPIDENLESFNGFPPKPEEEVKKQSITRSLLSLGLFVGAFYLIFRWDITYILVLAGVILIHELGHYVAMRIFKYKELGIFFVPMIGAFATGSKENISQKQQVIILFSGPLPGVIIGSILYYFGLRDESEFIMRTANIFILLNLFNLLPGSIRDFKTGIFLC